MKQKEYKVFLEGKCVHTIRVRSSRDPAAEAIRLARSIFGNKVVVVDSGEIDAARKRDGTSPRHPR